MHLPLSKVDKKFFIFSFRRLKMVILSVALLVAAQCIFVQSEIGSEKKEWLITCDSLVEDLAKGCGKLVETKGSFQHKDLTITYWVYEDLENQDSKMDPLILIHGGPGCPSIYMDTLKMLACKGRKVRDLKPLKTIFEKLR